MLAITIHTQLEISYMACYYIVQNIIATCYPDPWKARRGFEISRMIWRDGRYLLSIQEQQITSVSGLLPLGLEKIIISRRVQPWQERSEERTSGCFLNASYNSRLKKLTSVSFSAKESRLGGELLLSMDHETHGNRHRPTAWSHRPISNRCGQDLWSDS